MFGEARTTGIPALILYKYSEIWAERKWKVSSHLWKDFVVLPFCNNDVVQGEISLKWQFGFDIPTESFTSASEFSKNRRLKPNNPEYVLRMIFLSCQTALAHILNSVSAYCNSISGEACWGRFLMPRPYSMGLGLHFFHSFRGRLRL